MFIPEKGGVCQRQNQKPRNAKHPVFFHSKRKVEKASVLVVFMDEEIPGFHPPLKLKINRAKVHPERKSVANREKILMLRKMKENETVFLLAIYDKNEQSEISGKELRKLLGHVNA